ncbi:MAG: hypothetical protein SW833_17350 [Cyanobacteriota bacterium]|nr:hypothetical protein [Cyanobacteriota bacterium]
MQILQQPVPDAKESDRAPDISGDLGRDRGVFRVLPYHKDRQAKLIKQSTLKLSFHPHRESYLMTIP